MTGSSFRPVGTIRWNVGFGQGTTGGRWSDEGDNVRTDRGAELVGGDLPRGSSARRLRRVLGATVAAAAVLAGACSTGPTEVGGSAGSSDATVGPGNTINEGTPVNGGKLVVAVGAESNGYNPAL